MKKEDLQKELTDLGIKFQDNDTNEQLTLMLEGHKAIGKVKELEETVEKQQEIIDKLNEKVSETDVSKDAGAPTVKVDGKVYKMPAPKASVPERIARKLGVKELTADAVKKDKKLAGKIVEMKLGFLVEVESKEKKES